MIIRRKREVRSQKQEVRSQKTSGASVFCIITCWVLCVFLFFDFAVLSQPIPTKYGNEWIRFDLMNQGPYSTRHFKMKIYKEGIYKLHTIDLIKANLPETSPGSGILAISPKQLQLFHLGIEQPLWVNGGEDGSLKEIDDFIAFYANKNTGEQDSLLYESGTEFTKNYYGIFSDTSAYFLTWDNDTNHLRYEELYFNVFSGLTPESYYNHEELMSLHDFFYPGYPFQDKILLSEYIGGEGWFGNAVGYGSKNIDVPLLSSIPYNFLVKNKYSGTASGSLEILLNSMTDMGPSLVPEFHHHVQLRVGSIPVIDKKFRGFGKFMFSGTVNNSDIDSINTLITLEAPNDISAEREMIAPAFIKLTYPRRFELNNSTSGKFILSNPQVTGDYYLKISGYPSATIAPRLIDVTNRKVINVVSGNPLQVRVPKAGNRQLVFLENIIDSNYPNRPKLKEVFFRELLPKDTVYNYIIICTDSLKPSADEYKTYRATKQGGNYEPVVIKASDVYNQFSYGEFHPLGVRRMANFFIKESDSIPHALLIIGNSFTIDPHRTALDPGFVTTIPPFGVPGSDEIYTSGLTKPGFMPAIPTGRLAFKSNKDIKIYLKKVISYEATTNIGIWSKNIFLLSGGKDIYQQNQFKGYIDAFANIAKGKYFGARGRKHTKSSSEPIFAPNRDTLHSIVNNGVSMITFFGHSTTSQTEINLGEPDGNLIENDSGYKNKNKYPLMIMNGCYTGKIFEGENNSIGQKWLSAVDKGALGFIGHLDLGYPYPLYMYTYIFYENACRKMFGSTWGELIQKTIDVLDSLYRADAGESLRTHARQVIFQGDPALRFKIPTKPDYLITNNSLYIYAVDSNGDPVDVSATSDSFALSIIIENQGKATDDSVRVSIHRTFPPEMNKDTTYTLSFSPVYNVDTLEFWIKSKDIRTKGENIFEVKIDYPDSVSEFEESNNYGSITFLMPTDGVNIISPYTYSIVNSVPIKLVAQSNDLLKGYRFFKFEMDTSAAFTSPLHQISDRIKSQWLPVWIPDTNKMVKLGGKLKDSVVYYWRVKVDTTFIEGGFWENSSFVFIRYSPTGWSQSHFNQFSKTILTNISVDTLQRKWDFAKSSIAVKIKSIGTDDFPTPCGPDQANPPTQISVNNGVLGYGCCVGYGLAFKVFDPTFESYIDSNHSNCYNLNKYYHFEGNDTANLRDFVQNIPENYIVFCWHYRSPGVTSWNEGLFKSFGALGVEDSLRGLKNIYETDSILIGFIFMSIKGQPGKYKWVQGKASNDFIQLDTTLTSNWYKGAYVSERIGPAQSWDSLTFDMKSIEIPSKDEFSIDIIGVDYNRVETLLETHKKIRNDTTLNAKPVNDYPFIRLKLNCIDTSYVTPIQLKRWQVTYEGVPEGTLNPFESLTGNPFAIDTLNEGEILDYDLAFHNISNIKFRDSIWVKYSVITPDRQKILQPYRKFKPLLPDSSFYLPGELNTFGLKGENTLEVEVNPANKQPELYHSNNILRYGFYVIPDNTPPLLDVVVDGKHIMNGDIVSPNPLILARLRDENKYLPLNDPNQITLIFKKQNDTTAELINYNNARVLFHAADGNGNKNAELEFRPGHLEDGFYELRARAQDRTGNPSGSRDYVITFEVINESTITYFYPYPNPFSTRTRFVYTLTGNYIPRNIRIQILTITGKVVREITGEELGNLKIGNNISDFSWDGTDEFGDKLANGLYLYRVILNDPENEYKHRATSGDKFFKNSIGKMYILR